MEKSVLAIAARAMKTERPAIFFTVHFSLPHGATLRCRIRRCEFLPVDWHCPSVHTYATFKHRYSEDKRHTDTHKLGKTKLRIMENHCTIYILLCCYTNRMERRKQIKIAICFEVYTIIICYNPYDVLGTLLVQCCM